MDLVEACDFMTVENNGAWQSVMNDSCAYQNDRAMVPYEVFERHRRSPQLIGVGSINGALIEINS